MYNLTKRLSHSMGRAYSQRQFLFEQARANTPACGYDHEAEREACHFAKVVFDYPIEVLLTEYNAHPWTCRSSWGGPDGAPRTMSLRSRAEVKGDLLAIAESRYLVRVALLECTRRSLRAIRAAQTIASRARRADIREEIRVLRLHSSAIAHQYARAWKAERKLRSQIPE